MGKFISAQELEKMEEQRKALSEKIAKAKRQIAKKNADDERKRRSHQMYVFAGDIEKSYEETFGEKLFVENKQEALDAMVAALGRYFQNLKEKQK